MFNTPNELLLAGIFLGSGLVFGIVFYLCLKVKNKIFKIASQLILAALANLSFFALTHYFNYGIFRGYMLILFTAGAIISYCLFAKVLKVCYNVKQRFKNARDKIKVNS